MINIFKSKISSAYVFSNAFPSYSIKARVLPMIFVDPHDLHWGPHLSDLHSSLGSLEHALSQSGPLQGLALSRHGACLCPESCRICFSSPPALEDPTEGGCLRDSGKMAGGCRCAVQDVLGRGWETWLPSNRSLGSVNHRQNSGFAL